MKVSKTKPRIRKSKASYDQSIKIAMYDDDNAYPQNIIKCINNSPTATSCSDVHRKFIAGLGFVDETFANLKANKRETFGQLHKNKLSKDFETFGSFAIHVGYNMLLQPVQFSHVPFEHCRYEIDSDKKPTGRIAVHPDWTKESGRTFKKDDVHYIYLFDPDTTVIYDQIQKAGGFDCWKGQIYIFSVEPVGCYPLAYADSVTTWMETEDSCANTLFRNVRHNFLPAGMIVTNSRTQMSSNVDENGNAIYADDDSGAFADTLKEMQGDENALKLIAIERDSEDEKIEFVKFEGENLDKQFDSTIDKAEQKISKFYRIPPVLRGESISTGFGANLIIDSYDLYNAVTRSERETLSEAYSVVFASTGAASFDIIPLKYTSTPTQPAQ